MNVRMGPAIVLVLAVVGCSQESQTPQSSNESVFDQLDRERRETAAAPSSGARDESYRKAIENERQMTEAQNRLLKGEDPRAVLKGLDLK